MIPVGNQRKPNKLSLTIINSKYDTLTMRRKCLLVEFQQGLMTQPLGLGYQGEITKAFSFSQPIWTNRLVHSPVYRIYQLWSTQERHPS